MWLLNLEDLNNIHLQFFNDQDTPLYAILSHTWLTNNRKEITFNDCKNGLHEGLSSKGGFSKVLNCCVQARHDSLSHCWIDTCCINKDSSAELSEAINSMYHRYQNAAICYAFLADVQQPSSDDWASFKVAQWFRRGWTLQDLLAPSDLIFFDMHWTRICSKADQVMLLSTITGIQSKYLVGTAPIRQASVAARMSWAAHRKTTRVEDLAYCLLGIFGIHMSLLYGE